ncbi:MAG: hypothetical protein LBD03_02570, partial [Methanobrevibacter sp.]|nr:hypothetical protein [Candidatus Methanovirga procula]
MLVFAPVVNNDTGDFNMYTDTNNASFNISAEPVRISDDSAYVSVKIETNEPVNKTFKLKFKNEKFIVHTIKLDNNMSSTVRSDDFNITSKNNNKFLEVIDNTTNESACNLTVLFENNETINYKNPKTNTIYAGDSIQDAINNAADGDTILLNKDYHESNIRVNKSVTIKAADGSDVVVNADGKDRVFYVEANSNITGLTITGGNTTTPGGGVYNGTVTNCTITNNNANTGGGTYSSTVTNCTITNNTASYGGGIYSGTVTNCTITNNTANNYGGGTYSGTVTNCTITNNTANNYGGGTYSSTVTNCTITNNTANNYGGGTSGGTVTNCTITNNTASYGGGTSRGTVTNCTITNNTANNYGGGTYSSTVNYCRITGNNALKGKEAYVGNGGVDFNWWGVNNISGLIGSGSGDFVPSSYYQLQLTAGNVSTVDEVKNYTGVVPVFLGCVLVLNGTNDSTGSSNLPDFTGNTTLSSVLSCNLPFRGGVRSVTPDQSNSFNVPNGWNDTLNSPGNYNLTADVDNENLSINITAAVDKQDTSIGLDNVPTPLTAGDMLTGTINLTGRDNAVIPNANLKVLINGTLLQGEVKTNSTG